MVSGDILFFVDFIKTELIPKKYNYLGMQGELEMTKKKLAKELMVKWLLENKGANPEEILEEITSHTYTEEKLK
ncbi:hypothetical protein [Bacillus paranthracis]|uniref:hypothetical protein n=1 Tax=Bacillus paranthracis TaxID=2026186 RepID=UPI0013D7EE52|nr:hypothetical protein [Bacillus paranthracis]